MKTYIFPGQGSQARGMGAGLFEAFPQLTEQADHILGYSIKELCLEDPRNELNKTQFTQPALFVVNALCYQRKLADGGGKPDYLAGHSLGEFNALLAAEVFDFETGLRLVQRRGELMSQASGGAMAAILNASKENIENILREHALANIDIANYNSPTQIVISGAVDEIAKAQHCFTGNMTYYPLNTSGAFHSRFMQPAQAEFAEFLKQFKLSAPAIAVIANATAHPYPDEGIADILASQIASTVRWSESTQYLLQLPGGADMQFEELGPGEVLTKLVRTIRQHMDSAPAVAAPRGESPATGAAGVAPIKVDPAERIRDWNSKYPIGAKVQSIVPGYGELETRTEAMVLFGHRAAVYMKGYNGYFDLDELRPA